MVEKLDVARIWRVDDSTGSIWAPQIPPHVVQRINVLALGRPELVCYYIKTFHEVS
jgi:hypothetical protein